MARFGTVVVWLVVVALCVAIYLRAPLGLIVAGGVLGSVLWLGTLALSQGFVRGTAGTAVAITAGSAVLGAIAGVLCGLPFGAPMMIAGAVTPLAISGSVLGRSTFASGESGACWRVSSALATPAAISHR